MLFRSLKVSLQNTGAPFDIYAGQFYAEVLDSNNQPAAHVKFYDVKIAGEPGSPQYVGGTFLTGGGTAQTTWKQYPIQTSATPVGSEQTVAELNSAQIGIGFYTDDLYAQQIPQSSAPFAEITLRRDAGVGGNWTLNLFWGATDTTPLSLPFLTLTSLDLAYFAKSSEIVSAVPEPTEWAACAGVALVGWAVVRRRMARG